MRSSAAVSFLFFVRLLWITFMDQTDLKSNVSLLNRLNGILVACFFYVGESSWCFFVEYIPYGIEIDTKNKLLHRLTAI